MTTDLTTPDSVEDPTLPTAKAYLNVDLTPVANITGSGEIPASHIGPLAGFGACLLISVTPALTLYAGHRFLTPAQSIFVIALQLVVMTIRQAGALRAPKPGKELNR